MSARNASISCWRRRQAGQVERGPADQRAPVGLGIERQPASREASPARRRRSACGRRSAGANRRRLGPADRLEEPVGPLLGRDVDARRQLLGLGRGACGAPSAIHRSIDGDLARRAPSSRPAASRRPCSRSSKQALRRLPRARPPARCRRPATGEPAAAAGRARPSSFSPPPWQSRQYALRIGRTCCSKESGSPARASAGTKATQKQTGETRRMFIMPRLSGRVGSTRRKTQVPGRSGPLVASGRLCQIIVKTPPELQPESRRRATRSAANHSSSGTRHGGDPENTIHKEDRR